jgi:hypothetical protein
MHFHGTHIGVASYRHSLEHGRTSRTRQSLPTLFDLSGLVVVGFRIFFRAHRKTQDLLSMTMPQLWRFWATPVNYSGRDVITERLQIAGTLHHRLA